MVLPSGTITMAQVNTEIGSPTTTNITLNDAAVRNLAGDGSPTSPFLTPGTNISMNDLRGKAANLQASGGTIFTNTSVGLTYRVHVFTSPGTFTVSYIYPDTSPAGPLQGASFVQYFVIAGGGGGGGFDNSSGGGGAGGSRSGSISVSTLPGSYPITVGAGGPAGPAPSPTFEAGSPGNNSVFSTITSAGGGGGGIARPAPAGGGNGLAGGSGGGGSSTAPNSGGTGNTPPVIPAQGSSGGNGSSSPAAGGGGGGGFTLGNPGSGNTPTAFDGQGGTGNRLTDIVPNSYGTPGPVAGSRYFAGGGGGGQPTNISTGGAGGGGNGGSPGTTNTGGGGGGKYGTSPTVTGGNGGSGIVILYYRINNA